MERDSTASSPGGALPDEAGDPREPARSGHEPPIRGSEPDHDRGLDVGTEAIPEQAHLHTTEHESGYGGKHGQPRVSSDQRPGT
jgi:hypothetical protein